MLWGSRTSCRPVEWFVQGGRAQLGGVASAAPVRFVPHIGATWHGWAGSGTSSNGGT